MHKKMLSEWNEQLNYFKEHFPTLYRSQEDKLRDIIGRNERLIKKAKQMESKVFTVPSNTRLKSLTIKIGGKEYKY